MYFGALGRTILKVMPTATSLTIATPRHSSATFTQKDNPSGQACESFTEIWYVNSLKPKLGTCHFDQIQYLDAAGAKIP